MRAVGHHKSEVLVLQLKLFLTYLHNLHILVRAFLNFSLDIVTDPIGQFDKALRLPLLVAVLRVREENSHERVHLVDEGSPHEDHIRRMVFEDGAWDLPLLPQHHLLHDLHDLVFVLLLRLLLVRVQAARRLRRQVSRVDYTEKLFFFLRRTVELVIVSSAAEDLAGESLVVLFYEVLVDRSSVQVFILVKEIVFFLIAQEIVILYLNMFGLFL